MRFGENSPLVAQSLNNLALLYRHLGLYEAARKLYERSLKIRRTQTQDPALVATACNNLGLLLFETGEFPGAKRYLEEALGLLTKAFPGDNHFRIAVTLNILGNLLLDQGDLAGAAAAFERSRAIFQRLGPKLPDAGSTRNSLGIVLEKMDRLPEARAQFRGALEIFERVNARADAATVRHNMAGLLEREGKLQEAADEFERVLALRQAIHRTDHYEVAQTLNNLALLRKRQGKFPLARELQERATKTAENALNPGHPIVAAFLANLASIDEALGNHGLARQNLERAIKITRDDMLLSFGAQSERQQLAMTAAYEARLGGYLSLSEPPPVETAYEFVLGWKGAVFTRQRQQRLILSADSSEAGVLGRDLMETTATLASLSLAPPSSLPRSNWQRRVLELTEKKERLEQDMAARSSEYREGREFVCRTPRNIQAALPANSALVNFVEYPRYEVSRKPHGREVPVRHLTAFVVRAGQIARVELGPSSAIGEAADRWLKIVTNEEGNAEPAPATELDTLVWSKLKPHLAGVALLLVSPDGALGRFPFGCLPGAKTGRYLIEDVPIAVVAVPQLLPELVAERAGEPKKPEVSLLLVGPVDYDASPGLPLLAQAGTRKRSPSNGKERLAFPPLDSTREIDGTRESFRHAFPSAPPPVSLSGAGATEGAFRDAAHRHTFLHLATHGFFSPEGLRSALDRPLANIGFAEGPIESNPLSRLGSLAGYHPGLLSGLALTGANLGARPPADGGATTDDGILTALEVAELDLTRAQMVVLSACVSALGQQASGEGLLGLQRAFQMAGARTVVASLWPVDNDVASQLMNDFYRNLWDKKLSAIEALRKAQLEVKNHGQGDSGHPRYWAAWVLSGDPQGRAD